MNRSDEIKAAALDAAQHVTQDPEKRAAMADDLIALVGLMIQAVGKSVAIDGESDMNSGYCNDPECDCAANGCASESASAHTRYLTGERMQDAARQVVDESKGADLTRYEGGLYGRPAWRPRCIECGVRVGMPNQFDPFNAVGGIGNLGHAEGCLTGRVECPRCHATSWPHKPDCMWNHRHAGTAKYLDGPARPATGEQQADRYVCHWSPDCTGPEGCPNHNLPRCPGCGEVADGHSTSCVM